MENLHNMRLALFFKRLRGDKMQRAILKLYIEEIVRTPLLTKEEEIELSKRVLRGDKAAVIKLVKANLCLVVNTAKPYAKKKLLNFTFMGLIAEGNAGLVHASERFDWRKKRRFTTYAKPCIKGYILNALYGWRKIKSLDAIGDDDKKSRFYEVADKKTESPDASVGRILVAARVRDGLSILKPKNQEIISFIFGLDDGTMHTQKEAAKWFKMFPQSISRIVERSFAKLATDNKLRRVHSELE